MFGGVYTMLMSDNRLAPARHNKRACPFRHPLRRASLSLRKRCKYLSNDDGVSRPPLFFTTASLFSSSKHYIDRLFDRIEIAADLCSL